MNWSIGSIDFMRRQKAAGKPLFLLLCRFRWADSVEKGRCRERVHFPKTSGAFDVAGRGGPRQHFRIASVIFFALLRRLFLPVLAPS
jgi:hypothetical protein